jgi:hypothetical protein
MNASTLTRFAFATCGGRREWREDEEVKEKKG